MNSNKCPVCGFPYKPNQKICKTKDCGWELQSVPEIVLDSKERKKNFARKLKQACQDYLLKHPIKIDLQTNKDQFNSVTEKKSDSKSVDAMLGVDIGSTFTRLAVIDDHNLPKIVQANSKNELSTRTLVSFLGKHPAVGRKKHGFVATEGIAQDFLRHIGNEDWHYTNNKQQYTAGWITAKLLEKLVRDAKRVGINTKKVVLTCQPDFGIRERKKIFAIAKAAKLDIVAILDEPLAAVIGSKINRNEDQQVVVFDLGGSSCKISLVEIKSGELSLLEYVMNPNFGGRNWDIAILKRLKSEWEITKKTISSDNTLQNQLYQEILNAKHALTSSNFAHIQVGKGKKKKEYKLSKTEFNKLSKPFLDRAIQLLSSVINHSNMAEKKKSGKILLVGGASRMPQISDRIKREFNILPILVNPEEAIVKGASSFAWNLVKGSPIKTNTKSWGMGRIPEILQTSSSGNPSNRKIYFSIRSKNNINIGLLRSSQKTGLGRGVVIASDQLLHLGKLLPGKNKTFMDQLERSGQYFYTPVVLGQSVVFLGEERNYVCMDEVDDLRAYPYEDHLRLEWRWPKNCAEVLINYNRREWPTLNEEGNSSIRISKSKYNLLAYFELPHPRKGDYYIVIRTIGKTDGKEIYSAGDQNNSRIHIVWRERVSIEYKIKLATRQFNK
jgi:actin-like ATPase involved in cell morphogenesis